jgi:hypothetical protein
MECNSGGALKAILMMNDVFRMKGSMVAVSSDQSRLPYVHLFGSFCSSYPAERMRPKRLLRRRRDFSRIFLEYYYIIVPKKRNRHHVEVEPCRAPAEQRKDT